MKNSEQDSVTVICYGEKEVWNSREDAIQFYEEGVFACDGHERERYAAILVQLMEGESVCTDEDV